MGFVMVALCTGTSWAQGEATGFGHFHSSSSQDKRWSTGGMVGTEILKEQKKEKCSLWKVACETSMQSGEEQRQIRKMKTKIN